MSGDAAPHVVEDFLGIVRLLSDGSVVRGDETVLMPAQPFPDVPGVQWKDAVYDAARGHKVRVYRPSSSVAAAAGEGGGSNKLPVLVHFHGGGYCIGSYDQLMPAQPFPDVPGVQWKDAVYDAARGHKVRVYRPSSSVAAAAGEGGGSNKLPVLVHFHGGGYCIGSYDQLGGAHHFNQRLAADLPALVLSVQYRLAPEHRLPAAIEDGATFLAWLREQAALGGGGAEPWLAESADFSRTFLSGISAGANLAHNLAVQVGSGKIAVEPVRLAGSLLFSVWFGGVERTATESNPPEDVSLTVEMSDMFWRMALPAGATRDHPLANPFGPDSPDLEAVALPPAFVEAPESDVLRDRVLRYAAALKEMGKAVELAEFKGEKHGFSVLGWGEANEELIRIVQRFVRQMK